MRRMTLELGGKFNEIVCTLFAFLTSFFISQCGNVSYSSFIQEQLLFMDENLRLLIVTKILAHFMKNL
jgi:hypothetical protein